MKMLRRLPACWPGDIPAGRHVQSLPDDLAGPLANAHVDAVNPDEVQLHRCASQTAPMHGHGWDALVPRGRDRAVAQAAPAAERAEQNDPQGSRATPTSSCSGVEPVDHGCRAERSRARRIPPGQHLGPAYAPLAGAKMGGGSDCSSATTPGEGDRFAWVNRRGQTLRSAWAAIRPRTCGVREDPRQPAGTIGRRWWPSQADWRATDKGGAAVEESRGDSIAIWTGDDSHTGMNMR